MLNKMLRATLSKLKKVCIESFTPRIFRGDYYIPGKFQKFSATTLSRAHKSTDSGGSKDEDEKCKKLIDELFNSKVDRFVDPTTDLSNVQELKREKVSQILSPEAECQVCEKLISQAFGKEGGDDKLPNDAILSATTAKQTEEQLAQKVETIDEIPLVEAAKPKIEGFNVKPKVLGAEEDVRLDTLKFDKYEEKDRYPATVIGEKANNDLEELCQKVEKGNKFYHAGKDLYKMPEFNPYVNRNTGDPTYTGMTCVNHPYDDIAKRCINFPPNKIDRHILSELQRLGVPHSGGYASNSDNIGNVDDLSRQINNFNLQRGNIGDSPPDTQALSPPYENEQLKVERPMIYEQDKKPLPVCMMEQHVIDDTIMTLAAAGPKPGFNPNRMLLDPFDKKSLCYDCVDPEYDMLSYDKVHVLVQRLENKKYIEHNVQEENYEIKPLHESPRLPERPVNLCNENYTIHPANREQHYSMDQFQDSKEEQNQMNYQENMIPNRPNNQQYQQHNYHVNTPINLQNQQHNFLNRGYQNNTNYYTIQSGEQNHPTVPEEGAPIINLPQGQQPYLHSGSVHVFTNAATDKSETPETVETVLPHKENITAEEVAEHIRQQTSRQLENISNENVTPGSAEEHKLSQQLNYGEQSPARQEQFLKPNEQEPATEQEHLGRPIEPVHVSINDHYDPYDLRRDTIEQTKGHGTLKAHQEQLDIKEQKQPNEEAQILGSVNVHSEQLDKKEQPMETQILGSVKAQPEQLEKQGTPIEQAQTQELVNAQPEQLDKQEQPIEQAQILRSVKAQPEQLDKQEQPIEQAQILGSVKAQPEQLDKQEQPAAQAQILGSVKVRSEQLDNKEQTIEQAHILGSVKAQPEQLDKQEQPIEQAQILGSVKAQPEQLDKQEQPATQAQILGSVRVPSEQLDKKEQQAEQTQILASVKVISEQLDNKEKPSEQAQILGSVKAQSEQLDKKEQPATQAQILGSVKVRSEQLDNKEQTIEQAHILGSVKAHLEPQERPIDHVKVLSTSKAQEDKLDLTKQSIEQLKILGSMKAHQEQLEKKEQQTEQAPILGSLKGHQEQIDLKEQRQPIEQLKILGSVKHNLEPQERPIEHVKGLSANEVGEEQPVEPPKVLGVNVLGSVKADQKQTMDEKEASIGIANVRQERLELKKQAIDQLRNLETAKSHRENLEKKEQFIEHVKLLSSVKPQQKEEIKEQATEQPKVFGSINIQEAPEDKAERIQEKSKSDDSTDEFKKKLSSTLLPLPKLNTDDKLPLSVLLKRLRERSKIETCHDLIEPVGRKCGSSPPPCPPPPPTCPPPKPCPPPPCPPPPPPCPKPCKPACPNPCGPPKPTCPPKKPPCSKYIQVDTDFDFAAILRETDVFLKKQMYETVTAILTKEVIVQLEKMGVSLLITYPNEVRDFGHVEDCEVTAENFNHNEAASQVNATGVDLAKDYEPWVPIPSWPIPRKVKRRPLVCPKDGCKIIPPPRLNPPCSQNPCIGFPKRKNSFSTPDSSDLPENVSVRYEI